MRLIFLATAVLPVFLGIAVSVHAELPAARDRLDSMEMRIDEERNLIKELLRKEGSLLTEMDRINKLLDARTEELRELDRQARMLEKNLDSTKREIEALTVAISAQKERLKTRMRSLYNHYREGEIASLVSTGDYQSFIQESKLISYLTQADKELIEEYGKNRDQLEISRRRLLELEEGIRLSKSRTEVKKQEVEIEIDKKKFLLDEVRKSKKHKRRLLREMEQAAEDLRELIRREEEARKAALPAVRVPFVDLKGRLPGPVSGRVTVKFGQQIDPLFDTPVFRNGVEIQTTPGEMVRAAYPGVVVFADWFKGFGQLVIISHGPDYHTLYAHLSETYVKRGERVTGQQEVGRVGNTGSYVGPTLYFEIRRKGRPIDPLAWLVKDTKGPKSAVYIK